MTLKELKPEFWEEAGIGSVTFECPVCRMRIAMNYSRMGCGFSNSGPYWKATGEIKDGNFSLEPSIQNHPIARNWKPCNAHFTINCGQIVMA